MPRRHPGTLTRTMSAVWPAVRAIESQRESHAAFWDDWNSAAAREDGPLWIALGDSSTQGIGAPDPSDGWVPRLLARLREHTGEPWRVINLSITGAQLADVRDIQLPRIEELTSNGHRPALVTHLAGANDLMAPGTWFRTRSTLRSVLHALPDRAVVARIGVSTPLNGMMARALTRIIEQHAEARPFHLFWPWAWPSRDGLAEDRWHPGPKGYHYMADLIWEPVCRPLGLVSPPPS